MTLRIACLAAMAALTLAGCSMEVSEEVAEKRRMGKNWAQDNDIRRVSDCGALEDNEEQRGCAEYVESID